MPDRDRQTLEVMQGLISHPTHPRTPDQIRMESTLFAFMEEYEACKEIFIDRNKVYKNTFEHLGLIGTIITLIGDCYRLKNMIVLEADHGRTHKEQIEDKLRDVVNQALISLMMLHQDNYEGK